MRRTCVVLSCWFLAAGPAGAQEKEDSISVIDSLSREIETLAEQSTGNENSPILDDLQGEQSQQKGDVEIRSRFMQQLQRSKGYIDQTYLGSPLKSCQWMKVSPGQHVSAAVILQKDAGERNFDDFTAGYLRLASFGPVASIVVGDYLVESGQGVALWRAYEVLKCADVVVPVKRSGKDLVPYASADENSFLRGAAVNLTVPHTSLTVFSSIRSYSGTVDSSGHVTDLYTSGYFRTVDELSKQNAFQERLVGGRFKYEFSGNNSVGLTGYSAKFSRFLNLGRTFQGSGNGLLSADYDLRLFDFSLFGEWTFLNGSSLAGISGAMISPVPGMDLISAYRSYPSDFFSLHGNGFGDRAGTSNERGLYVGLRLETIPGVAVTSYYDQFRSPAPTATLLYPSGGDDFLAQLTASPFRRLHLEGRYCHKTGESEQTVLDGQGRTVRIDDRTVKTSVRVNGDYRFSSEVSIRARMEVVDFETQLSRRRETGMMTYQDIALKCSPRLTTDFRIIWFGTDSYDAGVGEYENDVPGQLTVPVLYGRGVRWYWAARYDLTGKLEVSLKYSDMIRDDVRNIGSGLDELPTNHDNRIGFQMDIWF